MGEVCPENSILKATSVTTFLSTIKGCLQIYFLWSFFIYQTVLFTKSFSQEPMLQAIPLKQLPKGACPLQSQVNNLFTLFAYIL